MLINTLLFLNLGAQEVVLVLFAVLLLFGGEKLPELARGLGKGIREFKDASDGVKREINRNINELTAQEELKRDEEIERARERNRSTSNLKSDEELSEDIAEKKLVEEPKEENNLNNQNQ
jgi:sec-independent protein translocase protein TatA